MNIFQGIDFTKKESVMTFINNMIKYATDLIGIVCVIFIVVGGIQLITAGGNQEQATKAKNTLTWAIVGLILVVGAKFIVDDFILLIKG